MRRTLLSLPLAIVVLVVGVTSQAAAQEKRARGTVMAVDGAALTLEVPGSSTMTFAVDEKTRIEVPGAGTATRRAQSAGQRGVKLSELLKNGLAIEISYTETSGVMHAGLIRRVWSSVNGPVGTSSHGDSR